MKLLISAAVSLLLISLASVSFAQIPQAERQALLDLYTSTRGWGNTWPSIDQEM